jgi:hypothetical protein
VRTQLPVNQKMNDCKKRKTKSVAPEICITFNLHKCWFLRQQILCRICALFVRFFLCNYCEFRGFQVYRVAKKPSNVCKRFFIAFKLYTRHSLFVCNNLNLQMRFGTVRER